MNGPVLKILDLISRHVNFNGSVKRKEHEMYGMTSIAGCFGSGQDALYTANAGSSAMTHPRKALLKHAQVHQF